MKTSYIIGRFLGKHALALMLAAVALIAVYQLQASRLEKEAARAASTAAVAERASVAQRTAQATADKLAYEAKCQSEKDALLTKAEKTSAAKNPQATLEILQPCAFPLKDDKAYSLKLATAYAMLEANASKLRAAEIVQEKARLKGRGVELGMTQDQVIASSWGKPQKVNRSIHTFGVREQWVYGDGNYLYFRDGKLDSIQN